MVFFATDPFAAGVAQSRYGGAFFLDPAWEIPDVWSDPPMDRHDTLEKRLLAAGILHSRGRQVAVVSPGPPPASWRRSALASGRNIVHLPLRRFGGRMLERLRTFHILNGKHVRSHAADSIHDP